jgi:maleylacetoacetate isomerase
MRVLQRVAGGDAEKQVEFPREVVTEGFKGLEIRLGQLSGTYSFGDRLTMADLFVVPMVANALRRGVDMTQFPILSRLNESLSQLPAFKRAHPSSQPDCPQTD